MSEELTKEDVRKIEEEILKRKLEIRPQLIEAVKEMQKLLKKYKKNISDTIEKNITVKLLYWLENNFSDIKINGDKNIKVVAENIQKESEIYFFIFLNL